MLIPILVIFVLFAASVVAGERLSRRDAELEHHYLQTLIIGNPQSERYVEELAHIAPRRAKRCAAKLLATLSPIIYRLDFEPLERVSQRLQLSDYLLFEARRSRGARAAYYLSLLTQIPFSGSSLVSVREFCASSDPLIRFYGLMLSINADSANAMRYIADYGTPLTQFELTQIVAALRSGTLVVAYQPMLEARSENLNMVGLSVVRHFGIESAVPTLHRLIAEGDSYELRREALYTLASMRETISTPSIAQFVRHSPALERLRFMRYLAIEGYSQSALAFFATQHERQQVSAYINSYKIKIRC